MPPAIEQLPNEPLLHHILRHFPAHPRHVLVRDAKNAVAADCSQLLRDMLHMRRQMRRTLPPCMFDAQGRIDSERPYVIILAPGNYDFVVAALATLACGGAFAPVATTLSPEEVCLLLEMTKASCILFSPQYRTLASQTTDHYYTTRNKPGDSVHIVEITQAQKPDHTNPDTDSDPEIQINPEMQLDPKDPGVLMFTSGTTGPPKGVVRPRNLWYGSPSEFSVPHVAMNFREPHWITVTMSMIQMVLAGLRIEIIEDSPQAIWEMFAQRRVTYFCAMPVTWAELMRYFRDNLDGLHHAKRRRYIDGVCALQRAVVVGAVSWPAVMQFWKELLGRPLANMYGSTEVAPATVTTDDSDPSLERCIGKPWSGVRVKLSEGDHGEILLKSPDMFTHYIGNEAATQAAVDEQGYYKTGDFGHLVGDQYVIDGRSSTDFIPYYSLRVPVHEVEARLVDLPYICEAYVVSATFQYKEHIAALVRLTPATMPATTSTTTISLEQVRSDLQEKLQRYKLPTLLRVLQAHERVPETRTGKPIRKKIQEVFFSLVEEEPLPGEVECCQRSETLGMMPGTRRAWDWAGME
ncbi:hypothetical protein BJX61DRAFT_551183 [Aspergillus egyptiacus]|nr:hypothetical protein BJX61DRAFT_551183 [Aspergillus egyptiacus]